MSLKRSNELIIRYGATPYLSCPKHLVGVSPWKTKKFTLFEIFRVGVVFGHTFLERLFIIEVFKYS